MATSWRHSIRIEFVIIYRYETTMIVFKCLAIMLINQLFVVSGDLSVIHRCHFDPQPVPDDGILSRDQFTWMAVLEYLHLHTGLRLEDRVPRVSLIHHQFALTTASVASDVPEGYSLGNVVIVEYERDEESCGLDLEDTMAGKVCSRASYVVPVVDVIIHPEYTGFGAPESLALIKLMRPIESALFMAICMPMGGAWTYDMKVDRVYLLDFVSAKPKNYEYERKAIKRIHILTPNDCGSYLETLNISSMWGSRMLCTTGCSMRPGSALVTHDQRLRMGYYWHLTGIAIGGPPCHEPSARHRRNASPPRFVYVWPYVEWLKEVMMSHLNPFPVVPLALRRQSIKGSANNTDFMIQKNYLKKWEGRWYMEGTRCHHSNKYKFPRILVYEDYFSVRTMRKSWLHFYLNIRTDYKYSLRCIKVEMPNHFLTPRIFQAQYNATVKIPLARVPRRYDLRVQAYAEKCEDEYIIYREKWLQELKAELERESAD